MAFGFTALILIAVPVWAADEQGFIDRYDVKPADFATTGRNDYFVLEPDYQLVYQTAGKDKKDKTAARLITTVLKETEQVGGVETRVVESVEIANDLPRRVTRTYLAIDKTTHDVYCFGRAVDRYDTWREAGHAGGWRAGENGARYGLLVPGKPQVGQKFYEALAPRVAMDRAEIVSMSETVRVPANRFADCLKMIETTPTSAKKKTERIYAPGVGLLIDGGFELVRSGIGAEPRPDAAGMIARAKERAKANGEPTEPVIPHDLARAALAGVGVDPDAEHVWKVAINDPALSPHQRSDLIEDLNENGFEDPGHVQPHELPIVLNRLALIEELAPNSMDDVNAAAFAEAYKDLVNIADKLSR